MRNLENEIERLSQMARPRLPTDVLETRGTFKQNPARGRARENEPKDTRPIGDAPGEFIEAEVTAWAELERAAPQGVLKAADRPLLELASKALTSLRERTMQVVTKEGVETIDKPFDNKAAAVLLRCLTEMGLTPASRSKVQIDKPPAKATGFAALTLVKK